MAKWTKKTYKLDAMHGWKAKPGYNIFVADRGAVRFDIPQTWTLQPGENQSIEFHDKEPPDDDCVLHLSVFHLARHVDWAGLPMARMLSQALDGGDDDREVTSVGPILEESRGGLDLAWRETRWVDSSENRDACTRTCLAHRLDIQVLLTMEFWTDDIERFSPVWDEVLRTLRLSEYKRRPDL